MIDKFEVGKYYVCIVPDDEIKQHGLPVYKKLLERKPLRGIDVRDNDGGKQCVLLDGFSRSWVFDLIGGAKAFAEVDTEKKPEKGDRVMLLGTKDGKTDWDWRFYFEKQGRVKGTLGTINDFFGDNFFVKSDDIDCDDGYLYRKDFLILKPDTKDIKIKPEEIQQKDDLIDAFVMSTYFMIQEENQQSLDINQTEQKENEEIKMEKPKTQLEKNACKEAVKQAVEKALKEKQDIYDNEMTVYINKELHLKSLKEQVIKLEEEQKEREEVLGITNAIKKDLF